MANELEQYKPLVDEVMQRYGLAMQHPLTGVALHKTTFNEADKTFTYTCIDADPVFRAFFYTDNSPLESINYATLFPENKESKFDWRVMLGHVGEFRSVTKYYAFSTLLNKWFSFAAICPEKGLTLLVAQDITSEKELEIKLNKAKSSTAVEGND